MNNALLYLGAILITALAVLFAVPRFVDWNSYRGVFEEEASRVLGREVRVGGGVNVRLLPAPFVSFERLRIADAGDAGGTSIIRVESFTMWLSVPPLLRGVLEAHRVELRKPVLSLATNADGGGNWRTLALAPGGFGFAPKEVALQSVQIHDGAITVNGPERNELARLDAINGELTAEALEGPFRFKGIAQWGGTPRHVKLATSKIDENGVLRFKTAIDVPDSANSYVFDGRISNIKDKPAIAGDLSAKFALAHGPRPAPATAADPVVDADPASPAPKAETEAPRPTGGGPRGFDLKAKVTGSTTGVKLTDIAVSLDAGATPQLITGEATFDWQKRMRLDVALASRWLDLDQIAPPGDTKMPLEGGRAYFEALAAALPQEADTNARLEFDQLTLGGEPIGNVRLAASRAGGPLELKGVRADLPGGVRIELDGVLTPSTQARAPRLDGSLFLSGKSLLRFIAWGFANADFAKERNDGPFSLDGSFALGDATLALTNATFELSGTPLTGDLKIDLGEKKKLAMAVQGPRIDVAQVGPGLVGLSVLRELLLGREAAGGGAADTPSAAPGGAHLLDPRTAELSLDLKAAQLVDGDRVLKDVDTSIRLERGVLSIPRLRFSTPQGLSVEADGEAKDIPARPQGTIRGLVSAPNTEAARAFIKLLDVEPALAADLDRAALLAPLRLAGTLRLAGGETDASTLTVDGSIGTGRLEATVQLSGGRSAWRTSPLDVQATLDNSDVARVLAVLSGATPAAAGATPATGRAVFKAVGVPSEELLTLADASADGLSLSYRGKLRLPEPAKASADGHLQVVAADARTVLSLTGLSTATTAVGASLSGSVHVRHDGGATHLASEALTLGTSILSGDVTLAPAENGRRKLTAQLSANKASFASLLWPVLGTATDADVLNAISAPTPPAPVRARPGAQPQAAAAAPMAIVWPEQTFDFSALDGLDGTIDMKIGALEIEPGLAIRNARVAAALGSHGITVRKLSGDALGGRLLANLDIAKAAAGVDVSGALRIDLDSKPLPPDAAEPPPPGDAAAFGVTFSGRALSPAAAVATLTGNGEITIGETTLTGNSPAGVSAVARAALTGQGPNSGNALAEAVREALKSGEVSLGKITIPVEISDGALKLERVRIEMKEGRSTFTTAVELATMKIDSEWQIEPKLDGALATDPQRALLPPVTVVYAGKLSQFSDLVPAVSASALERELVVRKMELDVGELERLRKLDEERARKDAERRKAEDAERARLEAERQKALQEDQQTAPATGEQGSVPAPAVDHPAADAAKSVAPPAAPAVDAAQWAACTESGAADAAAAACERLLAAGGLSGADQAKALYSYARALRDKGAFDRAIENYNRSIALAPSADAYNHRGIAYFEKGDYAKAIADYDEALLIDPNLAEALNNRAWTRYTAGDATAALGDANRAISLDGRKAYVWDTRGHINETLGQRNAAIADYRKALELDPGSESSAEGLRRLGATASEASVRPDSATAPATTTSQRPPQRRKRPAEDEWRPFQVTPY